MHGMRRILAVVTATLLPLAAGAATVQEIFERYALGGTWAPDCTKPVSRQNPYLVYRVADDGRLEREAKIEPGKIYDLSVAVSVVESKPDELIMAWDTHEGGITNRISIQPGQMQVLDSTGTPARSCS